MLYCQRDYVQLNHHTLKQIMNLHYLSYKYTLGILCLIAIMPYPRTFHHPCYNSIGTYHLDMGERTAGKKYESSLVTEAPGVSSPIYVFCLFYETKMKKKQCCIYYGLKNNIKERTNKKCPPYPKLPGI